MGFTAVKGQRVIRTALDVLIRELVLARTVWTDAVGLRDFAGSLNDTVTIKVPAYTRARKNALRSGATRTRDSLVENSVAVQLTDRIYKDIEITDENFELDIEDFVRDVMSPSLRSLVRGYEDTVADMINAATYRTSISVGAARYDALVDARQALNAASVPQNDRFFVCGTEFEAALLKDDLLKQADSSGSTGALREAIVGRVAGFNVMPSVTVEPDKAYAYHRTAFILAAAAPRVPDGAPWGERQTQEGFALRAVQVLDPDTINDILATEAWVGTKAVTDTGAFVNGRFEPSDGSGFAPTMNVTGVAATDLLTTDKPHGFKVNDIVQFATLTGGAGLSTATDYYVIATDLDTRDFKVSATQGGAAVDVTTALTAGTVHAEDATMFVRGVELQLA